RPGYREFFLDLATNPNTAGLIHVSRLAVGATSVAANLGLVFGDCYYHVLASHDDGELSRYGPGALHLPELAGHATERGLQRFAFTIGDEPYKQEWSDAPLKLYDHVAGVSRRGFTASRASLARRSLRRLIKQTPFLWRSVRHARSL